MRASARPHVNHPVGTLDDVKIVLDHHDGVPGVGQFLQHAQEFANILEVETRGGFIQHIKRAARGTLLEFRGQLDSLRLTEIGEDRVRISGARGEAPPPDVKVSVTEIGGFRQQLTFPIVGLHIEQKTELIKRQFEYGLQQSGLPRPASMNWTPWKSATALPNWWRSRTYSTAASSAPWAMPTACAPMVGRVWSRVANAVFRPEPGAPMIRSPGMRQSSK